MAEPPSRTENRLQASGAGAFACQPPSTLVLLRRPSPGVRRADMERFARRLQDEVADGRAFECLITDDHELRKLNAQFLGKDYATDVLSFPAVAGHLGSLAISAERARSQAKQYGHTLEQELRILMLHGLLHLLGMDHESDRGKMARTEAGWRRRLSLPNGLIERARA